MTIETNEDADIGEATLFALRGAIDDADQDVRVDEGSAEPAHGRLYGLLSRFQGRGRASRPPSELRLVRPPGCGIDYLDGRGKSGGR